MTGSIVAFTPDREQAGTEILALADFIGFEPSGAAWVWTESSDHWRFLLISHMVDSKGPAWVYDRLIQVFQRHTLPADITPLDLLIASPRETSGLIAALGLVAKDKGPGAVYLTSMFVNGFTVDFAAVYRMLPLARDAGARTRAFERRVTELLAA